MPPSRCSTPAPGPADGAAGIANVMICDDSAVIRTAIARMLCDDPNIRVVAKVANGKLAVDEVRRQQIDVVILDIEMPVMDGLTALPLLLSADPGLRIIVASTLTTRGADVALRALRLGAADYVPKPDVAAIGDNSFRNELIAKVKGLARLRRRSASPRPAASAGAAAGMAARPAPRQSPLLLAVGSSTGGPQALFTLIQGLGTKFPVPIVITQHMPPAFTPILADHLTRLGGSPCAEAVENEPLVPGRIFLAPGDRHLIVERGQAGLRARLSTEPRENYCRPSVDPMLRSAGVACNGRILVVMLTGMGHDGLEGTRQIVESGGSAIAQDEATSVVWGMPGAIAQAGLCHQILPLSAIAGRVRDLFRMTGI